ncbi:MAG: fused MFS/spermidine synthase, partial [Alphaproteobacteria bacterium]|nr:fused MFS/spermidine synthase [Alphaproteobacteria bacterium]
VMPSPLALQRDFFGVKRVMDRTLEDGVVYRTLLHGTTSHGMQQRTPTVTTTPHLYYAKGSGLYDVISYMRPQRVGIVGLGMGAVSCMQPKGASVRYFEIDAGVEHLAKKYFTFLQECPAEVVIGDARMTLAHDTNTYDMLLLDAFSSDSIPVHLLTQEMFKAYEQRVDKDGALVLHISNRYLNLRHVVAGVAQSMKWHGAVKFFVPENQAANITASEYAVLSKNDALIKHLIDEEGWISLDEVSPLPWTDDYISIIPILNFGFGK